MPESLLDPDSFYIEPLSLKTLRPALSLVNRVFPREEQGKERADLFFTASLFSVGRFLLKLAGYPDIFYWVARDKETGAILGTVGLYTRRDDPDAYWGGWMCVEPVKRGKRIGLALGMQVYVEAIKRGDRKYGRLYTSTHPGEATAQTFYDELGLQIYKEETDPITGYRRLYRQVELK